MNRYVKRTFLLVFCLFLVILMIPIAYTTVKLRMTPFDVVSKENRQIEKHYAYLRSIYGYYNNIFNQKEIVSGTSIYMKDDNGYINEIKPLGNIYINEKDIKVIEFDEYCKKNNIDFIYANFPRKSFDLDSRRYGYNFNIEAATEYYLSYAKYKVDFLDIYRIFKYNYNFTSNDIHYRTDHHWRNQYAFLAAKETVDYLNNVLNYDIDPELLNIANFDVIESKGKWIGEVGKKVSNPWAGYDGFTIIYPKYETSYKCDGRDYDFRLFINPNNKYFTNKGNYPVRFYYENCKHCSECSTIHNNKVKGKKVLLIHDSFSMAYAPFMSLVFEDLTMWDLRTKKGSVYDYLKSHDIDLVIVAYAQLGTSKMFNFY